MKKNILILLSIISLGSFQLWGVSEQEIKETFEKVNAALGKLDRLQEKYAQSGGNVDYLDEVKDIAEDIKANLKLLQSYDLSEEEVRNVEVALSNAFIKINRDYINAFKTQVHKELPSFTPEYLINQVEKVSEKIISDIRKLLSIYADFTAASASPLFEEQEKIDLAKSIITSNKDLFIDLFYLYLQMSVALSDEDQNKIVKDITSIFDWLHAILQTFEDKEFKAAILTEFQPLIEHLKQSEYMQKAPAEADKLRKLFNALTELYTQTTTEKELPSLAEYAKDFSVDAVADIKTLSDLDLKFRQTPTGSLEEQNTLDEMKKLVKDSIAPNLDITFKSFLSGIADLPDKDEIIASSQLIPEALLAYFKKAGTPEFKIAVVKELKPVLDELKNAPVMKTPEGQNFKDFFDQFDGMIYTSLAEEQMAQEGKKPQINISKLVDHLNELYISLTSLRNVL